MTSRHFFAGAVFLPVFMAAIGLLVQSLMFFVFFLLVGGIPYVLVAAVLVPLIIRARSIRALALLSVVTPVVYGASLSVFSMILWRVPEIHLTIRQYVSSSFAWFGYGATFSAMFVLVSWLLWVIGVDLGFVKNEFPR